MCSLQAIPQESQGPEADPAAHLLPVPLLQGSQPPLQLCLQHLHVRVMELPQPCGLAPQPLQQL